MDSDASPTASGAQISSRLTNSAARKAGLYSSNDVTVATSNSSDESGTLSRPPILKHVSTPAYRSPLRHHQRHTSIPHRVKESLDARSEYITSEDDGAAEHRINQYTIKQEIGRGSFGSVHLAIDQYGQEYAVKEFSKARLRKRAQSHILRQPLAQRRRGGLQGFNNPLHRMGMDPAQSKKEGESSTDLIKEELAIMKKLNHPNLVQLIEVLDDPTEDSLYMVMEMCKKGVVMKVDLEHRADPYPEDLARFWFRDLILGIEYLHAQGVVHRDIKPDNCLITSDDVLKVVDFGVSEMFSKDSEMKTAKSAGSPAFLPPELCVAKHGDVSGKAADIWSMGVTLYCLKFGRIPFERDQILELYESIQTDEPDLSRNEDESFGDLMRRILEKDPEKRISMAELRTHPWVTRDGTDPLLSEEENTANPIEPPTEAEMNAAITGNMRSLMTVVKAVNKFKALTANQRPPQMASILDEKDARFSQPPEVMLKNLHKLQSEPRSQSVDVDNRKPLESKLVAEGVHRDLAPKYDNWQVGVPEPSLQDSNESGDSEDEIDIDNQSGKLPPFRSHAQTTDGTGKRGQARDPLQDHLYLFIGPSTFAGSSSYRDRHNSFVPNADDIPIVSESPGAAEVDIYETAYRDEIERIMARAQEEDREPQVYLTRRVDAKLMAISGLAGRWMAVGEEAKNQIKDYTHFSARKARVTEVSRALREAAKQEYEKRRQERKALIQAAKVKATSPGARSEIVESPTAMSPNASTNDLMGNEDSASSTLLSWKGKAVDRSKQARTSFKGIVGAMKNKSRQGK